MEKLEQFVRNNSELFDTEEPRAGHLGRFEAMLKQEAAPVVPIRRNLAWMRVAATVVVLVTAGLIGFDLLSGRAFNTSSNGISAALFTPDTREALDYYASVTNERMSEIDKLAQSCPEGRQLKTKALREAAAFDANHRELTAALQSNPGNEKMEAAVIRNQKLKEEALSNIILQGNMEDCNRK